MTSPRIARALLLVDEVRAALDAAGLTDVHATIDAGEILTFLDSGVVCVAAPKLSFSPPFGDVQPIYELHAIAGPADDYLAAWGRVDAIVQALVDADVNMRSATPGAYAPMYGENVPSYEITLNELD